jgi:signal peptidase II
METPANQDSGPAGNPEVAASTGFRKRPIFRDFDLLQLAAIFFLLDQLTKLLVRAYLPFGHSYPDTGFFRFTHAKNTGSAFGLFQGHNTPLIFISFVGIFVLAMIYQSQPRPTNLLRLSLGLQIGGALGNLVDRFRLGAVTDFIDVGPWPIFNLADSSIICGLLLLGWIILQPGRRTTAPATGRTRDYSLKRRGRRAGCGRFHSGRRFGCRTLGYAAGNRRLSRRTLRR